MRLGGQTTQAGRRLTEGLVGTAPKDPVGTGLGTRWNTNKYQLLKSNGARGMGKASVAKAVNSPSEGKRSRRGHRDPNS